MKTAITISGAQRYHHQGLFKLAKQIQNWGEVDLFVRIWKHPEFAQTPEQLIKLWYEMGLPPEWNFRSVELLDDQPPHHPPYIPLNLAHWAPNFLTMWWGIVKSNELRVRYQRQTHAKYDLVFRLRTDSFSSTPDITVDLTDYVELAKTHMITGINYSDVFQFGSSELYDKFVGYWDHLKQLSVSWEFIHPEESLEKYLNDLGIPTGHIPLWIAPHRHGREYGVRPGDW